MEEMGKKKRKKSYVFILDKLFSKSHCSFWTLGCFFFFFYFRFLVERSTISPLTSLSVWVRDIFLTPHSSLLSPSCWTINFSGAFLKTYHAGKCGEYADSSSPYAQSKWKLHIETFSFLEMQPRQKGFQSSCSK